jgi:hypothetical protein
MTSLLRTSLVFKRPVSGAEVGAQGVCFHYVTVGQAVATLMRVIPV